MSEPLWHQPSVSSAVAHELVALSCGRAAEDGLAVAAAVVDAQGIVLALLRMDGVAPPVAEFALDKAFTAATMRRTTAAFAERMGGSPSLTLGLSTRSRLLAWGGGLPVLKDGRVVGGLGVSGAKDHEDIACARHALGRAGFDLPD